MLGRLTAEQRKELISKYPYLMPKNAFTGKPIEPYDYSFIVCEYCLPEGWFQLFLQFCEDIYEPLVRSDRLADFRFTQIKEKFGRLTIYTYGASDEVHDIINKYSFLSEQVCSSCGKPASVMTYGYICPYCNKCAADYDIYVDDAEIIEIKTSYIQECRSPEGTTKTVVDCTDEWNRYLERICYIDDE